MFRTMTLSLCVAFSSLAQTDRGARVAVRNNDTGATPETVTTAAGTSIW